MIRLLALVPKVLGVSPSQRFRLEQWAPLLKSRGIQVDFSCFESPQLNRMLYQPGHTAQKAALVLRDFARRGAALRTASKYDAVVIHREVALLGPAVFERILARLRIPIIYDFDDAIWEPQVGSSVNGVFSQLRFPAKTGTICRLASAVSAGNEYLARYARQHTAASNVFIVPTTIDLERYPVQPKLQGDSPFVIIWSGSQSTLAHLEFARPAIERLAAERKVTVRVICNAPPKRDFRPAETVYVPWKEQGEAESLGAAHVGIMPLPDDAFTRGKCALKALQYMAVGIPVVLSPVGANAEVVADDDNGLWARASGDWYRVLRRVAEDRELREGLAAAGRRTVEGRFSAEIGAARLADAVRHALQSEITGKHARRHYSATRD